MNATKTIGVGEILTPGFYRFTFTVPSWIGIPTISIGKTYGIPLTTYEVKLTRYEFNEKTRVLIVEVEVYTIAFLNPNSYKAVDQVRDTTINDTAPVVRYSGGYAKASVPVQTAQSVLGTTPRVKVYTTEGGGTFVDRRGAGIETPTAVPQVIVGAILLTIGLGVLYLCLDKVEQLVESPTVNLAVIGLVAVGAFVLYRQLKTA